jgi:hypothetical protein
LLIISSVALLKPAAPASRELRSASINVDVPCHVCVPPARKTNDRVAGSTTARSTKVAVS